MTPAGPACARRREALLEPLGEPLRVQQIRCARRFGAAQQRSVVASRKARRDEDHDKNDGAHVETDSSARATIWIAFVAPL